MKTILAGCLAALLCFVLPQVAPGQDSRFELGQRLRAFEVAWECQTDAQARAKAVPHLNAAVNDFFSFRLDQAAHSLDRARFAVQSDSAPAASVAWATALSLRPGTRLVDTATVSLEISLAPFYKVEGDVPKNTAIHLALRDGAAKTTTVAQDEVLKLPWRGKLPWAAVPEGDYQLTAEIIIGKDRIALNPQTLSVAANTVSRLQSLEDGLGRIKAKPNTTQRATIAAHLGILKSLVAKETPETNYPAARLLDEAEAAMKIVATGGDYFGKARPGEFWITLANDQSSLPVRLMAPESVTKGKPLPLVIALHGAGGSENMFFDAYGNGKIAELCRQRGWLLVAPRLSLFGPGMPVDRMIAEISQLYPVDKQQVFIVGHSMGAMQAINLAQQASEPVAAIAAVSGGGRVGKPGNWTKTAFLVIAGDQDFGLPGARRLSQALRTAGSGDVRFKEYKDAEHLGVVQAALGEVFSFFDEIAAKVSGSNVAAPAER
jgi:predicted esterase